MCIISTAQQASPNVMGQIEPRRAQFMRSSTLDTTNSAAFDIGVGGGAPPYGAGRVDAAADEAAAADAAE